MPRRRRKMETLASQQHRQAELEKKRKIAVKVRCIQKEAEYLMRCGRYQSAVECLNQILNFLPKFDLAVKFPNDMPEQTQILFTTRAEAWLLMCKMENALNGFVPLCFYLVIWQVFLQKANCIIFC